MSTRHQAPSTFGLLKAMTRLMGPLPFEAARPTESHQTETAAWVDLYKPSAEQMSGPLSHTAVFIVHGGGFVIGSKRMKPVRALVTYLVNRGAYVCSVGYTLVSKGGTLREATAEVQEALTWWREHLHSQGELKRDIFGIGLSAGACPLLHVVRNLPAHWIAGAISAYGAYTFPVDANPFVRRVYQRLLESPDANTWKTKSILDSALCPQPVLLLHGEADTVCSVQDAQALKERRDAKGLETVLLRYPEAPHGFLNSPDTGPAPDALHAMVQFMTTAHRTGE